MLAWWSPLQETVRRWSEHNDARLGRSQVKQWGLQPGRRLIRAGMPIQYRGLGLQEHGSHHSGRRLVNAVDDFGRETTVPGGRGLRWKSACTTSAMGFEVLWILHSIIPNELCKRPTGYVQ